MSEHQRVIAKLQRQLGLILGCRTGLAFLSTWLLVGGLLILMARGVLGVPSLHWLWFLTLLVTGVLASTIVGVVAGLRRRPSPAAINALVDNSGHFGGLLMSSAEADVNGWSISVSPTAIPRIRWDARKRLGILAGSLAFLVGSFLIPTRYFDSLHEQRLLVADEINELKQKIEILKEEKILPSDRAESFEETLKQVQKEASGRDPAKTWEAMDHLEQSLAQASAEAAEAASQAARQSSAAEELATALDQAHSSMTSETLSEAMQHLAEDLSEALAENSLLGQELPGELQKKLASGQLDPSDLKKLVRALQNCKNGNLSKLKSLADAKMIDADLLKQCEGECQGDSEALAALLAQCQGSKQVGECLANRQGAGRGGISRGRGDAAMSWTDGTSQEQVEFKQQALPPGAMTSIQDATLQGISAGAPDASDPNAVISGGSLNPGLSGRGSAHTQVILPEHKKIVQRYFSRQPAKPASPSENP